MQLLGAALVHAQRIEDLDKSRFAMVSLFGKYLMSTTTSGPEPGCRMGC